MDLVWLLLYCQDLCVKIVCYPFLSCISFKETIEPQSACRKMIFQLLGWSIWQLWIAMFSLFEYPWWRRPWTSWCALRKDDLPIVHGRVYLSLLWGLGFSFPLPSSAVNLVTKQEVLQSQTLDKSQAWRWRVWTTFNIGKPYPFRHDNYIFNLGSSLKGLLSSCTLRFQMEILKTQIKPFFLLLFSPALSIIPNTHPRAICNLFPPHRRSSDDCLYLAFPTVIITCHIHCLIPTSSVNLY